MVREMLELALERVPEPVIDPPGSDHSSRELHEEIIQPPPQDVQEPSNPHVYTA
jgi:hypothetical protein